MAHKLTGVITTPSVGSAADAVDAAAAIAASREPTGTLFDLIPTIMRRGEFDNPVSMLIFPFSRDIFVIEHEEAGDDTKWAALSTALYGASDGVEDNSVYATPQSEEGDSDLWTPDKSGTIAGNGVLLALQAVVNPSEVTLESAIVLKDSGSTAALGTFPKLTPWGVMAKHLRFVDTELDPKDDSNKFEPIYQWDQDDNGQVTIFAVPAADAEAVQTALRGVAAGTARFFRVHVEPAAEAGSTGLRWG